MCLINEQQFMLLFCMVNDESSCIQSSGLMSTETKQLRNRAATKEESNKHADLFQTNSVCQLR